jgi:hypothetical protein
MRPFFVAQVCLFAKNECKQKTLWAALVLKMGQKKALTKRTGQIYSC